MSDFTDEIKEILENVEDSLKTGSKAFLAYVAERQKKIAEAIAADTDDLEAIVKQEALNMEAYAMNEAVEQAEEFDDAVRDIMVTGFSAFVTVLIAAL